jgi:hypothetical protein
VRDATELVLALDAPQERKDRAFDVLLERGDAIGIGLIEERRGEASETWRRDALRRIRALPDADRTRVDERELARAPSTTACRSDRDCVSFHAGGYAPPAVCCEGSTTGVTTRAYTRWAERFRARFCAGPGARRRASRARGRRPVSSRRAASTASARPRAMPLRAPADEQLTRRSPPCSIGGRREGRTARVGDPIGRVAGA